MLQWHFDKKYLLTGTPVQNNLKELYALLSFISPVKFGPEDCEDFVDKYSDVEETGWFYFAVNFNISLQKHAHAYTEIFFSIKIENFSGKIVIFFLFLLKT